MNLRFISVRSFCGKFRRNFPQNGTRFAKIACGRFSGANRAEKRLFAPDKFAAQIFLHENRVLGWAKLTLRIGSRRGQRALSEPLLSWRAKALQTSFMLGGPRRTVPRQSLVTDTLDAGDFGDRKKGADLYFLIGRQLMDYVSVLFHLR